MEGRNPSCLLRILRNRFITREASPSRPRNLQVVTSRGRFDITETAVKDLKDKRAFVEPGATLADFDHDTQVFGLATPLGINSTTGVAGLTLGGGFGWLSRKYGMSVDNLVSADVVTADGKLVRASASENPDLF